MIKHIDICDRCNFEVEIVGGEGKDDTTSSRQNHLWESEKGKPSVFSLCTSCEVELGKFIWHP